MAPVLFYPERGPYTLKQFLITSAPIFSGRAFKLLENLSGSSMVREKY